MKKIVVCILLFLIFINVKADENIFPITEKHTFEMGDESILVSIDNNYNLNFIGNNLKNSKKCSIIFKFYDDSKNLITEEYYTSDIIKNSYTNSIRRNAEFTPFYYNASFDCSDLYSYTTPSNYNYTKPSNYHSNDNDELSSEEFLISVVILIIISATTVIFAEKVRKKKRKKAISPKLFIEHVKNMDYNLNNINSEYKKYNETIEAENAINGSKNIKYFYLDNKESTEKLLNDIVDSIEIKPINKTIHVKSNGYNCSYIAEDDKEYIYVSLIENSIVFAKCNIHDKKSLIRDLINLKY